MSIQLEVWGDYALFTRPEMKTERVSYDVMTPSAARGLIAAPEFREDVKAILKQFAIRYRRYLCFTYLQIYTILKLAM